jgi:hypothetical protein
VNLFAETHPIPDAATVSTAAFPLRRSSPLTPVLAPFLVRDSRTAPTRSILGATRNLPANLRQRLWSPHHRDKAADGYVPARTCLEPVFKVGTCYGFSLMTFKLLFILYSIIYSRNKIVKSRRATVFSIPRTLMQPRFWCEQPSYIAPHASSAKEPGTPNPRRRQRKIVLGI